MPRPRFYKLPEEKRERILDNAAKEFAAHGYSNASLNQILENAGVSKGAAYYYFDDKADLFVAVVEHYIPQLVNFDALDLDSLTAETFWSALIDLYSQPFIRAQDKPWAFRALKSVAGITPNSREQTLLQGYVERLWGWAGRILDRGQQLGVVRSDIPRDLLLSMLAACDQATDDWFLQNWEQFSQEEILRLVHQVGDMMKRLFSPL
jgi:AcrR family transcriptional regulator